MMPSKDQKSSFYKNLNLMLSYNPVYTSPYGDMALFSSMERTKLCYLVLKSKFKISHLNQIGWDILTKDDLF